MYFFRIKDNAYNSFSFYYSGGNTLYRDSFGMEKMDIIFLCPVLEAVFPRSIFYF